jgi:hypothetical protein
MRAGRSSAADVARDQNREGAAREPCGAAKREPFSRWREMAFREGPRTRCCL